MAGSAQGAQRVSNQRTEAALAGSIQWQPLGPGAVESLHYGLTTGRITSLALDPSDATGNRLYVGSTGGGVWVAQNAATNDAAQIVFTPLTDAVLTQPGLFPPSISIGALSVQPTGTGVILAGTGDPNDALDSYYGAGILRSADNGRTWTLIQTSADLRGGQSQRAYAFVGESFAGFAWSTASPQTVVAAVSHAYETNLVDARWDNESYSGLYYSNDNGASWHLARIMDSSSQIVQGPTDAWAGVEGNAATAVVWNPVRRIFIAAVRFHGYYQSSDGVTWTRLASQPGSAMTAAKCPTRYANTGSPSCPIFRGALAINPTTGDTFAWTVDVNNQDQGLWQDVCSANAGACAGAITFAKQWNTSALETNTSLGSSTILDGDYNLGLAAVTSVQDTLLFAGAHDLWKCSLASGCAWRNTTNSLGCMSAQVGAFQHALEWNSSNPLEVFVGNDYGLWRSMDAVGEAAAACDRSDADHFQNLNGGLGSLAELNSMAVSPASPYTMLVGLGANGTAGVNGSAAGSPNWPEILDGIGGPVAIDSTDPDTWYVNNGPGVSIHACSKSGLCTPGDFGSAIGNAQVSNDGQAMTAPAPFLIDPADPKQLLIGTCRVWRGPASGLGWTSENAVSAMLDGNTVGSACKSNALIRSLAAAALGDGGEVVYSGTYGLLNGGASLPGHVFRGVMNAGGAWTWKDLSADPVSNDIFAFNASGMDVSSIAIDPHDATGNTVYVTIAGMPDTARAIRTAYRSTDGGAHWKWIDSNLPWAPASALVVDPADANTAYLANDDGVFITQAADNCGQPAVNCWSGYGSGLPQSPVVALTISGGGSVLVAGTYGRGVWQAPLAGAGGLTTATVSPNALSFAEQTAGITSSAQSILVTNTGGAQLTITAISVTGDFSETDDCLNTAVTAGASCTVRVTFTPAQGGSRTGSLTIAGNLSGGSLAVPLSGTGVAQGDVSILPAALDFGAAQVGSTSSALSLTIENARSTAVGVKGLTVSGPFAIAANACGTTSLVANSDCQLSLTFSPTASGAAEGTVTLVDDAGTQTAQLTGIGTSPPTDALTPLSLSFPGTVIGQASAAQTITLTNSGGNALTSIQESVGGPFQLTSNCTTQLIGGSSCSLSVSFLPTAQGVQAGTLTVSDILRTQSVSLSGTGLLPPAFTVTPPSLSFGGQTVGAAGSPLGLTITNSGGAAMANVGFQITGTAAASFAVSGTTCGARLNDGASCTAQIVFTPPSTGAMSATLTVTSSTIGVAPVSIALSGTGQAAAALAVSPAQLTFAGLPVGLTSEAQTLSITNTGGSALTGLSLVLSPPFSFAQNTCGSSLAAGASCSAGVVFTPVRNGPAAGSLSVSATGLNTPAVVALLGTGGVTGALRMQPAMVSFPATGVGTTSEPVDITISNASSAYSLANFTAAASPGFRIASTTCGASLAPAGNCTVAVVFAPSFAGAQSGDLTISSTTLAASATAALAGEGYDYSVAAGTTSRTVVSGQTASFALTLTPAAGAGAAFTFQCGALPAHAACVFTPSSNTVAANTSGTETLQITTSDASANVVASPALPWRPFMLLCGILLGPLSMRRSRRFLWMLLLFACITAGLTSCASSSGGGGNTAQPGPNVHMVSAGTYSIPVVITSNGLQRTVTLTLVVN